jgi:hypothetical protein
MWRDGMGCMLVRMLRYALKIGMLRSMEEANEGRIS